MRPRSGHQRDRPGQLGDALCCMAVAPRGPVLAVEKVCMLQPFRPALARPCVNDHGRPATVPQHLRGHLLLVMGARLGDNNGRSARRRDLGQRSADLFPKTCM